MKKILFLLLLIPFVLSGQTLIKENTKVINNLAVKNVTKDSVELRIQPYIHIPSERDNRAEKVKVNVVEVQLDWSGFTDTLNSVVQVWQRTLPTMNYYLYDQVKSQKTISTASGNYLFTWSKWAGSDLKIVFLKNKADSGSVNVAVGLR
jgi:hypothetical protein